MALVRLYRPHVTWALAYENAFADPADPTVAELNDDRFVHFISCALTEDGTEFNKDDSDTDDTVTYCDIGQVETPTRTNYTASLQWLLDANTGGSGSTADTTSLYNKVTALLGREGIRYWLIQRIGPGTIAQDSHVCGRSDYQHGPCGDGHHAVSDGVWLECDGPPEPDEPGSTRLELPITTASLRTRLCQRNLNLTVTRLRSGGRSPTLR